MSEISASVFTLVAGPQEIGAEEAQRVVPSRRATRDFDVVMEIERRVARGSCRQKILLKYSKISMGFEFGELIESEVVPFVLPVNLEFY